MSDDYRCYQTAEFTHVVDADDPPEAVVTISRAVGNPTARVLMRICAAVLNDDHYAALGEVCALDPMDKPPRDLVVCLSGKTPTVGQVLDHEGCYGPHHVVGPEVM